MQAALLWLLILAIMIWSLRYDLGIMDRLYDKGIYKDKLLDEIRRAQADGKPVTKDKSKDN